MLLDATADRDLLALFTDPTNGEAVNADSLPFFRIFGASGVIGDGTCEVFESGSISAIAVGSTTTITAPNHGLKTGQVVTIAGAGGVSNVNGNRTITVVDGNNFTFTGVTSSGTYTSGGTWKSPGLYKATLDATIRSALEVGKTYKVIYYGTFSGVVRQISDTFTVVA